MLVDFLDHTVHIDRLSCSRATPYRHTSEISIDTFAFGCELLCEPVANDSVFEDFALVGFDVEKFAVGAGGFLNRTVIVFGCVSGRGIVCILICSEIIG